MQVDGAAAIAGLESTVADLLGDVSFERLLVAPERVGPVGIGGFVGFSADPRGEIAAARVEAVLRVVVRGASSEGLDLGCQAVMTRLMGLGRAVLAAAGVHSLRMLELGDAASVDPGALEREVRFRVRYEHQLLPSSAEGIIEQIPIELETAGPAPAEPPIA